MSSMYVRKRAKLKQKRDRFRQISILTKDIVSLTDTSQYSSNFDGISQCQRVTKENVKSPVRERSPNAI